MTDHKGQAAAEGERSAPYLPSGMPNPQDGDGAASTTVLDGALDRVAHRVRAKDGDRYAQSGQFANGNRAALRHGKYSRAALRKVREAKLEAWRARYRDAKGGISPLVDGHLRQLARLEAISDRALQWSERTRLPVTSHKHGKVLEVIQGCADRIGRHLMALSQWSDNDKDGANATGAKTVTFGGRWREVPGFRLITEVAHVAPQQPQPVEQQAPVVEAEVLPEPVIVEAAAAVEAQPAPKPKAKRTQAPQLVRLEGWL